jgi:hypothetical protein
MPLNSSAKIPVSVIDSTPLTQANAGSAGGTINYINEGGIKRAWGISSAYSLLGNSFVNGVVTFPASFFSSITGAQVCVGEATSDGRQFAAVASPPTATSITLVTNGVTGSATSIGGKWYWEVMGA